VTRRISKKDLLNLIRRNRKDNHSSFYSLYKDQKEKRKPDRTFLHLRFAPDDLQRSIIEDDQHKRILCIWGRQRGKTTSSLLWLFRRALKQPRSINWFVGPTLKQVKRVAWMKAKRLYSPSVMAKNPNESTLTFFLKNGARIQFMGADDPDSLRGDTLNNAVLDEYGVMKPEAWTMGIEPMLSTTNGHALFISTPNALKGLHLQKLWEEASSGALNTNPDNPTWRCSHAPSFPSPHMPPEVIERARREMRDWQFRQEYEASFEEVSGRIWPEFRALKVEQGGHLIDPPDGLDYIPPKPDWTVIAGCDFGFDHPTVVIWIGVDKWGHVVVLDEYVAPRRRITDHLKVIVEKSNRLCGVEKVVFAYDPSAVQWAAEFEAYGLHMIPAINAVHAGIDRVGAYLKNNYLLINSRCHNLIKGMLDYAYDPRAAEPRPLKINDDECDALRYALMAVTPPFQFIPQYLQEEIEENLTNLWEPDPIFE